MPTAEGPRDAAQRAALDSRSAVALGPGEPGQGAAPPAAGTTTRTPRGPGRRRRFGGARAAGAESGGGAEPVVRNVEPELPRRWAWAGLAVVLAGALALRLWGI